MQISFLDLREQYLELKDEIDSAVLRVLDGGWYILGRECECFEDAFKEYLVGAGEGYVVGVNSGTDALKLSLLAAGVEPGDEVITVANTAIPTVAAICSVGAVPVFCDVDPRTWLIDSALIEGCLTSRTKAIIAVHLYGGACDMVQTMSVAKQHGLVVIEDVAQATGSKYKGSKCGTIGRFGAFSFYPSKNLGACGDGGAVFARSPEDRDCLRMLRNYGQSSRYRADLSRGENSRLDELQAVILGVKLKHLDRWNDRRRSLASLYRQLLAEFEIPILTQQAHADVDMINHLFVVQIDQGRREKVQHRLSDRRIQTFVHYPVPLYQQPAFSKYKRGINTVAERLCASVLSLPYHQYLSENEIEFISQSLFAAIK